VCQIGEVSAHSWMLVGTSSSAGAESGSAAATQIAAIK
jgi:hypothetical protein